MNKKREALASLCHKQWSGWMFYLYTRCQNNTDDTMTIPATWKRRWLRQMQTPYTKLRKDEKESDRKEADRILKILARFN